MTLHLFIFHLYFQRELDNANYLKALNAAILVSPAVLPNVDFSSSISNSRRFWLCNRYSLYKVGQLFAASISTSFSSNKVSNSFFDSTPFVLDTIMLFSCLFILCFCSLLFKIWVQWLNLSSCFSIKSSPSSSKFSPLQSSYMISSLSYISCWCKYNYFVLNASSNRHLVPYRLRCQDYHHQFHDYHHLMHCHHPINNNQSS